MNDATRRNNDEILFNFIQASLYKFSLKPITKSLRIFSLSAEERSSPYGLFTVMLVPLLSPSGSWLLADVTFPTVNVTLAVFLEIPDSDTVHVPFAIVVHEPVPPILPQEPLTVASGTPLWLLLWTVTVTLAVQVFPCFVLMRSKSPTCIHWLTVTFVGCVAVVAPPLSLTVNITW
jgi:hypothetical protein